MRFQIVLDHLSASISSSSDRARYLNVRSQFLHSLSLIWDRYYSAWYTPCLLLRKPAVISAAFHGCPVMYLTRCRTVKPGISRRKYARNCTSGANHRRVPRGCQYTVSSTAGEKARVCTDQVHTANFRPRGLPARSTSVGNKPIAPIERRMKGSAYVSNMRRPCGDRRAICQTERQLLSSVARTQAK